MSNTPDYQLQPKDCVGRISYAHIESTCGSSVVISFEKRLSQYVNPTLANYLESLDGALNYDGLSFSPPGMGRAGPCHQLEGDFFPD